MRTRRMLAALCAAATIATSCGYVAAGSWTDDPDNWKRAFDSTKPDDVVVVHSEYKRFAHWSFEFRYYFEIAPNTALRDQLFARNKLRALDDRELDRIRQDSSNPSWFLPKDSSQYDGWAFANEPHGKFSALFDKESGEIYLTDRRL